MPTTKQFSVHDKPMFIYSSGSDLVHRRAGVTARPLCGGGPKARAKEWIKAEPQDKIPDGKGECLRCLTIAAAQKKRG